MTAPTNPLLDTLSLPRFAELSPDQIAPALDEAIARHEAMVEALTTARPTDFARAWLPYERANTEIGAIWSAVSHLHGVADTPELRAAYSEGQKRLVENDMKVGQNRDLYEVFVALSVSPGWKPSPKLTVAPASVLLSMTRTPASTTTGGAAVW